VDKFKAPGFIFRALRELVADFLVSRDLKPAGSDGRQDRH
jgi:hypothetical protein